MTDTPTRRWPDGEAELTEDIARDTLDYLKMVDAWLFSQRKRTGARWMMAHVLNAETVLAALIAERWPEPEPTGEDLDATIPF